MTQELLFILTAALVAAIVLIVRQQNFRRRQLEHRERLAALEKGLLTASQGDDDMTTAMTPADAHANRLMWFRLTTLGLGFLLLFGGVGLLVALLIVEDAELRKLWTLGLVPTMTGLGLIAFWLLSRSLVK